MYKMYIDDSESEKDEEDGDDGSSSPVRFGSGSPGRPSGPWDSDVIVLSSTSASDSDDAEDLQDWMMVGGRAMHGDHSINLNLEGSDSGSEQGNNWHIDKRPGKKPKDGDEDKTPASFRNRYFSPGTLSPDHNEKWEISDKDRQAKSATWRYFVPKTCTNCRKTGHIARFCPTAKKRVCCLLCGQDGHRQYGCPQRYCPVCGLPMHTHGAVSRRPTYGAPPPPCPLMSHSRQVCTRCGLTGHLQEACPDLWRQYHLTTKTGVPVRPPGKVKSQRQTYCYNCGRDHSGHKCFRQRMQDSSVFFLPYVCHYDTKEEQQARQTATISPIKDLLQRKSLKRTWPEKRRERQESKRMKKERESSLPSWLGGRLHNKNLQEKKMKAIAKIKDGYDRSGSAKNPFNDRKASTKASRAKTKTKTKAQSDDDVTIVSVKKPSKKQKAKLKAKAQMDIAQELGGSGGGVAKVKEPRWMRKRNKSKKKGVAGLVPDCENSGGGGGGGGGPRMWNGRFLDRRRKATGRHSNNMFPRGGGAQDKGQARRRQR